MSVQIFDVGEVIARLQAEAGSTFALVEGIAALSALRLQNPPATPAAYVFAKEEASEDSATWPRLSQRTVADFGVLIVDKDVSDAFGGAAADALLPHRVAVLNALLGWQPASASIEISHVGGNVVSARDGHVGWEMTLSTAYHLRKD